MKPDMRYWVACSRWCVVVRRSKPTTMRARGVTAFAGTLTRASMRWEKRGKVRDSNNAVWIARILQFMAGTEAEAELLGKARGGDGNDRYQIALMLDEIAPADLDRYEARLRAMTRMLLRRHRARIERVAAALLAKTTLSARELDKLVGRSVADVKVNAPFLLAMHKSADRKRRRGGI